MFARMNKPHVERIHVDVPENNERVDNDHVKRNVEFMKNNNVLSRHDFIKKYNSLTLSEKRMLLNKAQMNKDEIEYFSNSDLTDIAENSTDGQEIIANVWNLMNTSHKNPNFKRIERITTNKQWINNGNEHKEHFNKLALERQREKRNAKQRAKEERWRTHGTLGENMERNMRWGMSEDDAYNEAKRELGL